MVGPRDIVEAAERHQSHATSNVANIAQQAALAALTGPQDTVDEMREAFDSRRKLMYSLVSRIPGVTCVEPEGAFYVFPDMTGAMAGRFETSSDLAASILEDAEVAVVPGDSFGAPGYIRLSYAVGKDQIQQGLDRIARLLGA
jgi:aspartate/methionine/tyrosine aminotransferase